MKNGSCHEQGDKGVFPAKERVIYHEHRENKTGNFSENCQEIVEKTFPEGHLGSRNMESLHCELPVETEVKDHPADAETRCGCQVILVEEHPDRLVILLFLYGKLLLYLYLFFPTYQRLLLALVSLNHEVQNLDGLLGPLVSEQPAGRFRENKLTAEYNDDIRDSSADHHPFPVCSSEILLDENIPQKNSIYLANGNTEIYQEDSLASILFGGYLCKQTGGYGHSEPVGEPVKESEEHHQLQRVGEIEEQGHDDLHHCSKTNDDSASVLVSKLATDD